jgi:DNA-binding MarR family transcriptional regulator
MNKSKLHEQSEKLLEVHRGISGFYSDFSKSLGLTLAEFEVLYVICEEENCTQMSIVQKTFLPKQTVNAVVQRFIKNDIVTLEVATTKDKRNKVIKLTENGKVYSNDILPKMKAIEYKALESVGQEKLDEMINLMTLYKNALKECI